MFAFAISKRFRLGYASAKALCFIEHIYIVYLIESFVAGNPRLYTKLQGEFKV